MKRPLEAAGLILFPWALVAIAALRVGVGLRVLYLSVFAGGLFSFLVLRKVRVAAVPLPRVERLSAVLVLAFFLPVLTMAVPPGADMAMHVAMARSIVEGHADLSPAWPGVTCALYPRGISAWTAALAPLVGLAKAGLVTACASYAVFYLGLAGCFHRVLRLPHPAATAALALMVSHSPQAFFGWGGNTTVLAIGLGLVAATSLAEAFDGAVPVWRATLVSAVLFVGAFAVHPTGALAAALVVAAVPVIRFPERNAPGGRFWPGVGAAILVLLCFGTVAIALRLGGPEVSPRERAWILDYQANVERIVRGPSWLFALRIWDALPRVLGLPYAALIFVSASLLFTTPAGRRRVAIASLAVVLWAAVVTLGRLIPGADILFYQLRFTPLLLLVTAPLLSFAFAELVKARPRLARSVGLGLVGLMGVMHVRTMQTQKPIATRNDVKAIECVARSLPRTAMLTGSYGDATQWIPALAGLPAKLAHPHCSLLDEIEAAMAKVEATHLFVGERTVYPPRYTGPVPTTEPLCRAGRSVLYSF